MAPQEGNAADDRVDLSGWVTIDNKSGATYRDAALKLVAGPDPKIFGDERAMGAALRVLPLPPGAPGEGGD
jgi:hypothetical protein